MLSYDIRDYGAKGDGITDDSEAIQKAISDCPQGGVVHIPEGVYACADIQMKSGITLKGNNTWGYRDNPDNSSCLILSRNNARCLINITDAVGSTLNGMFLYGNQIGSDIHGVMINKENGYGSQEDSVRIEKCRISNFSGDALHLEKVWCATVRDNMLSSSRNGLYIDGWDLFLYDNWFTANRDCGIFGKDYCNTAIICSGNRIEWNKKEGLLSEGGITWSLNNNHFDRNGYEGARFHHAKHINIVGNIFARDGWLVPEGRDCISLNVEKSRGISIQSNVFRSLAGDKGTNQRHSPDYDIRVQHLSTSNVSGNVMYQAAVCKNIKDDGEHSDLILKDNVGSLAEDDC